jgi:hypothetical protein
MSKLEKNQLIKWMNENQICNLPSKLEFPYHKQIYLNKTTHTSIICFKVLLIQDSKLK